MAKSTSPVMIGSLRFGSRAKFYVITLVALALLTGIYHQYVARYWGHFGFSSELNLLKVLASAIVLGIFCSTIPRETGTTRGFFLSLIVLIQLLPMLVLYSAAGIQDLYALTAVLAVFLVFLASNIQISINKYGIIGLKNTEYIIVLSSAALVVLVILYSGLENFNLNIASVYEHRGQALDKVPLIFSYIIPITTKFLIPFGVVIALHRKSYLHLILLIICAIFLFGLSSHKSIVFYVFLAAAIYTFWRYWKNIPILAAMFILALLVGVLDAIVFSSQGWNAIWGWYISLSVRRSLMVPAMLNYFYMEFFSNNPPVLWSGSRISLGLLDYPYELAVPNLIGDAFLNNPENSANTGYIGSGFSQAGILGVVIYSIGVGFVISLFDALGKKFGHAIVVAAVSAQTVTMVLSADFLTMFLTHGLLVSIVCLLVVRADGDTTPETSYSGIAP